GLPPGWRAWEKSRRGSLGRAERREHPGRTSTWTSTSTSNGERGSGEGIRPPGGEYYSGCPPSPWWIWRRAGRRRALSRHLPTDPRTRKEPHRCSLVLAAPSWERCLG